jgi:hypothetical protein
MRRILIAAVAAGLMAVSANAADPEMGYIVKIGTLMEKGDFAGAKVLRVEMEKRKLLTILAPSVTNLEHCIAAGPA